MKSRRSAGPSDRYLIEDEEEYEYEILQGSSSFSVV
jgi:hypothetical protein